MRDLDADRQGAVRLCLMVILLPVVVGLAACAGVLACGSSAEIGAVMLLTVAACGVTLTAAAYDWLADRIPRQRRNTWTPENLAEVRRLQAEGLTHDQMARRLGTSSTRIGRMLQAAGTVAMEAVQGEPPKPCSRLDPRLVVRELDNARAALVRAERRYAEVMEPVHGAIRGALQALNLPFLNLAEPERDLAEELCAAIRDQGYVIVQASRA